MEFPVDLLDRVRPESLEISAKVYMSNLLCRNPETPDYLTLPDSRQIEIGLCNMSLVPLYGADTKQKVLALLSSKDVFKVVALYLLNQWWPVEDILKTTDPSRTGLLQVQTPGERIVLYVLNRIIHRDELASDDVQFLCHGQNEIAKILWKDGQAIGFYSVKPEGSACSGFLTYQLPVMDTIFVRRSHRGHGYGLHMLEDFVGSFKNDVLGLKYPLTIAMYKVCKRYLSHHPEDTELLWEACPLWMTQIAKRLQSIGLKGTHAVVGTLNVEAEQNDGSAEQMITQVQQTVKYTEEIVEEVTLIKLRKEVEDMPAAAHHGSVNLKHKCKEDTGEKTVQRIRTGDIESGVQSVVDEPVFEDGSLNVTEATGVTLTHLHCEEQKELTIEPEECVLMQSVTEKAMISSTDPLGQTDMTAVTDRQSVNGTEETQTVTLLENNICPLERPPVRVQNVVEVETVKVTPGIEEINENTQDLTEKDDGKHEAQEETSEDSVTGDDAKTREDVTGLHKSSQHTQPVASKDVLVTEKISAEQIGQHRTEKRKDYEMENKGKTPVFLAETVAELQKEEENVTLQKMHDELLGHVECSPTPADKYETCEKYFQPQKGDEAGMTGVTDEYDEIEPHKKGKDNVIGQISNTDDEGAGETDKTNEKMETGVLEISVTSSDQWDQADYVTPLIRSSTKHAKDTSKRGDRGVKGREDGGQAGGEPNVEEREVIPSNTGVELGKEMLPSTTANEGNENTIGSIQDSVEDEINVERGYLDPETKGGRNLKETENKMEVGNENENEVDARLRNEGQEKTTLGTIIKDVGEPTTAHEQQSVIDFHDVEVGDAPENSASEPSEKQVEVPAPEMEATSLLKLQKTSVVLFDVNKIIHQQTSGGETAKEISRLLDTTVGSCRDGEEREQTTSQAELDKRQHAEEEVVKTAESENKVTDDVTNQIATDEHNDEKREEGVVKDDDGGFSDLTVAGVEQEQEEKPVKETSSVEEIQTHEEKETEDTLEPSSVLGSPYVQSSVRRSERLRKQAGETYLTETDLDTERTENQLLEDKRKKIHGCSQEENKMEEDVRSEQVTDQDMIAAEDPDPETSTHEGTKSDLHDVDTVKGPAVEGTKSDLHDVDTVKGPAVEGTKSDLHDVDTVKGPAVEGTKSDLHDVDTVKGPAVEGTKSDLHDVATVKGPAVEGTTSDLHDVDTVKGPAVGAEERATVQAGDDCVDHDEELGEDPATETAPYGKDGQNAMESTFVELVDCSMDSRIPTGGIEISVKTGQCQEEESAGTTCSAEEQTVLEECTTVNLEESVETGTDNTQRRGNAQEENVLAKEKLKDDKVREIPKEDESIAIEIEKDTTGTGKNLTGDEESMTLAQEEMVQRSSDEDTLIITSRSLRRRTVTVKSPPPRKSTRLLKPGVHRDGDEAGADKRAVNESEKNTSDENGIVVEGDAAEKNVEGSSEDGALEKQCHVGPQDMTALTAEDIADIELNLLRGLADQGEGGMEGTVDKENEKVTSERKVSVEGEGTTEEVETASGMESVEMEREKNQSEDEGIISLSEDRSTQEKEGATGSATGAKDGAVTQTVQNVKESGNAGDENGKKVTQSCKQDTAQESSDEEEQTVITKHLRQRTIETMLPVKRKSQRLDIQVMEKHTEKTQAGKEAERNDASRSLEGAEEIQNLPETRDVRTREEHSKDKCAEVSSSVDRSVVISDKQGEKDITQAAGVEELIHGEKHEGEVEKIESDKTQKEQVGHGNPEDQEENVLEEQELEEMSGGKSKVEGTKRLEEKEDGHRMSTTEGLLLLHGVEEGIEVERRMLRKRTITFKTTSEKKSKYFYKQYQDEDGGEAQGADTEDVVYVEKTAVQQTNAKSSAEATDHSKDPEKRGDGGVGGEISKKAHDQDKATGEETEREDQPVHLRRFINVSDEERNTNTVEEENKAGNHTDMRLDRNNMTDNGDKIVDTVDGCKEFQQESEQEQSVIEENIETGIIVDEKFTLEMEEEGESIEDNEESKEVRSSGDTNETYTTLDKTGERDNQITREEEEPAAKTERVLHERPSTTASPVRPSPRQLPRGSPSEQTEVEVVKEVSEEDETEKSPGKRKASDELKPRRSKRLATPKSSR